jgi:YD repeat-containing protein
VADRVNALGQTVTSTDRNGSVHTLTFDILGRITKDTVTTLGSGVNGSVRRIETEYDSQGNPYLITSYDATTSGSVCRTEF